MAHRLIAVVAAEEHLRAAGHNLSVLAYSRVDGRLSAAAADGLYLGYGVRDLKQPAASRENIRQEIGTQPEAEHRNIAFVNYSAKLIYLVFCKKLALIRNNDIRIAAFLAEHFIYIVLRGYHLRLGAESYTGIHRVGAVARVDARFYQPDLAILLFVVELGHERLGRF